MQSGITASAELQSAFSDFTADSSLFALPITIASESLKPLAPLSFSGDFNSSLASLTTHLQPKVPIYLVIRRSQSQTGNLIAVTYVPSTSPVRSKTLFASTRTSLVRDLGLEKFSEQLFVTDAEEVLDPAQWSDRAASDERSKAGVDADLLTREERELQEIKRAEQEARHGTSGRDLMGEGGSGGISSIGSRGGVGAAKSGIMMKITDDGKAAFAALKESSTNSEAGYLIQFGIDLSTETLTLLASSSGITAAQVPGKIPADRPSYSFYQYPATPTVFFIYVCPGTGKVKERMTYATSRNGILQVAKEEGIEVTKRLEASEASDITEQRLNEEAGVNEGGSETAAPAARQGFARPKRPGKR